ncbi:QacE family quaternary ammonium compound efflux SMR transporter [Helicobacter anseris]|uniref:Spermidine export protein MdtI n=1 Tax=Helicobacter anseris TaxID=375926 RepID=A0A3D8J2B2_9HELI|nr:SMR family transporter [Helicobacter anseris]RDU71533.1 QacE family quaternary ammonium compound efflux SMR transporter [Helicobacter anseris]
MLGIFCVVIAGVLDIIANLLLKKSQGFKYKIYGFSAIVIVLLAFVALSFAIRSMPLSVAYATWGALGIIGTVGGGYLFFNERLNKKGKIGIFLILISIVLLHLE